MFKLQWLAVVLSLTPLLRGSSVVAWWAKDNKRENPPQGAESVEEEEMPSMLFKNRAFGACQKDKWKTVPPPEFDPQGFGEGEGRKNIHGTLNPWDEFPYDEGCLSDLGETSPSDVRRILTEVMTNVPVIRSEDELVQFLTKGTLQLVVFLDSDSFLSLRQPRSNTLIDFLQNYDQASRDLEKYDIFLALVNCSEPSVPGHCLDEKSGNFAFGFQNQLEKIAFPLETLFSVDSIVASALHLSLLHAVPIIQSLTERHNLEARCRHRCDIVLSFQPSLGTKEHRTFLEASVAFKTPSFVFALTTYAAGAHGLPHSPLDKKGDGFESEPAVYVLHCLGQRKEEPEMGEATKDGLKREESMLDPCSVVSHFHGNFNTNEFHTFLRIFQLPLWHEILPDKSGTKYKTWLGCTRHPASCEADGSPPVPFETPFNGDFMPWVIFFYDGESEGRIRNLVPPLAKLLQGSVATLIMNGSRLNPDLRRYFRITSDHFQIPALLFFDHSKREKDAPFVSDFSDAYRWIVDRFARYRQRRREQDERRREQEFSDPYLEPEQLRQDDEMVKEMVAEELLTSVIPIKGEERLNRVLSKGELSVIAFYISWDPVCNMLLQHLHLAAELLKEAGSHASLHRLNCFEWPKLCARMDAASSYPVLKVFASGNLKMTYDGAIETTRIARSILLIECQDHPIPLQSQEDLRKFLSGGMPCPASEMVESFIAGIFPSAEEAETYLKVSKELQGHMMMGVMISAENYKTICDDNAKDFGENEDIRGCVLISKPKDIFQPMVSIPWETGGLSFDALLTEIRHTSEPIFAPLDPERLELASLARPDDEGGHPKKNQLSFILILSANNEEGSSRIPPGDGMTEEDPLSRSLLFKIVGRLAGKKSRPGVVFSYLEGSDEFREELLNAYGLKGDTHNLVALNRAEGQVTVFDPSNRNDEKLLDEWMEGVIEGSVEPSVVLRRGIWHPTMAGFDFLNYMEEDMLREAEEQLVTDMDLDFGHENAKKAMRNQS